MAEQSEAELQRVAQWKKRWDDAVSFYQGWHDLIGQELSFTLDQNHYRDSNESDPQRIKPADPALLNQQRFQAAQIVKASEHFEMQPIDSEHDPQTAADGKALLERHIHDPESEFQDALEDVIDGALAARIWGLEVGFDPDAGLHGELTFESRDPRKSFWTPGFKNPHSKRCPWLVIEKQMLPSEIERMKSRGWKNTEEPLTDSAAKAQTPGSTRGPISTDGGEGGAESEQRYVTVLFCYERFVKDTKPQQTYRKLDPDDHHMWCPNPDCGFRGMPQAALDQPLPDLLGDPCPQCGTPTQKVTVEALEKEILAYRKGRQLVVLSPYWGKEHFEGSWEHDTRGFTTLFYSPYNHPVNPIPNSDTFYYRSLVCVSDAMLRLGYEQMRKAHGIILAPQDSLFDAYGEPFPFSEHRDVAYYDNDFLSPGSIQWFQPPGLNQAWSAYFQTVQGVFAASKGTGDIPLGPDKSKDIAVGTIETLVETGNISVDRKIRRFQRFKSLVLTRAYEIMRSVGTTAEAVRVMGPDGVAAMKHVRASGLPGYDVIVTAEPTIARQQLEDAQKLETLAMKPPYLRKFLGRALNINPMLIAELEADEQAFLQAQKQQPPPNGINGQANRPPPLTNRFAGATSP